MKLLVRNLARTTTEAQLRSLFESIGKVQSCSLVLDKETGGSKGFAFIEMPRPGDAKAAVKTLNGNELGGNKIRVKKAEQKKESPKLAEPEKTELKPPVSRLEAEKEPEKDESADNRVKSKPGLNRDIWSK